MPPLHIIEHKGQSFTTAPPLLFVHGACLGAWCWEERFLSYFGQLGYHAVALDLRGHGGSAGHGELQSCTIDDYVADVAEVAAHFATPPVVIGHSMGGLIAQRFVARSSASGVALLAPSPVGGMRRYGWRLVRAHPLPFLKATMSRDISKLYPDNRRVRYFMFSKQTPEITVTRCRERIQPESWRACCEMDAPIVPICRPTCPMLVLGGELDGTVPTEAVRATAAAYRATVRIFSGFGHNLMLEPNWKDVADCINQWVHENVQPNQTMQRTPKAFASSLAGRHGSSLL